VVNLHFVHGPKHRCDKRLQRLQKNSL